MFNESNEAVLGIMVWDSSGQVLVAMAEKIWKPHNVESLEMLAARRAIIFAKELDLQQGQFEGDSEICIKALQMGKLFSSSYGHLVRDTLFHVNSFQSFSFAHTIGQGNTMAHALTQRARLFSLLLVWMEFVPYDVDTFVLADFSIS